MRLAERRFSISERRNRHEPIHGGFGKNILFLTISKTPFPTRRRATQSVRLLRS